MASPDEPERRTEEADEECGRAKADYARLVLLAVSGRPLNVALQEELAAAEQRLQEARARSREATAAFRAEWDRQKSADD